MRVSATLHTDVLCTLNIVHSHVVNALSFSFDGEFIAIANSGSYIDIVRALSCGAASALAPKVTYVLALSQCATETGVPLHRVPTPGPAPTVQWHPTKHLIAYCGQSKAYEEGPPPSAWISLWGPAAP